MDSNSIRLALSDRSSSENPCATFRYHAALSLAFLTPHWAFRLTFVQFFVKFQPEKLHPSVKLYQNITYGGKLYQRREGNHGLGATNGWPAHPQ